MMSMQEMNENNVDALIELQMPVEASESESEECLNNRDEINGKAKKAYSAMGWRIALYGVLCMVLQYGYMGILNVLLGEDAVSKPWYSWLMMIIPMYMISFPAFALLSKKVEATKIEQHKMGFWKFVCCVFMGAAICGVGAVVGMIVNMLILAPFGISGNDSNAVLNLMMGSHPFWRILTVGILAPIVEEMIFRKFLIDRVYQYGEWIAILSSGLMFGLFHGNFSQFFFATGLGLFYAFLYVRTGKIWYTIGLHMVVNLCTSVITMAFLQGLDLESLEQISAMDPMAAETQELTMRILPGLLLFMGWYAVLILSVLVGIVLWICFAKKLFLKKLPAQVTEKKLSVSWGNVGMILFFVYAVFLFIYQYASMIIG